MKRSERREGRGRDQRAERNDARSEGGLKGRGRDSVLANRIPFLATVARARGIISRAHGIARIALRKRSWRGSADGGRYERLPSSSETDTVKTREAWGDQHLPEEAGHRA